MVLNINRKWAAIVAAISLVFTGLAITPAQAADFNGGWGETYTYDINQPMSKSLGCVASGNENVQTTFNGALPPGLTWDSNTGELSGTPIMGGSWTFTNWWCNTGGGSGAGAGPWANTTIVIRDITHAPSIAVSDISDDPCTLVVSYIYPDAILSNSVALDISDGTNTTSLALRDGTSAVVHQLRFSAATAEWASLSWVASESHTGSSSNFVCGSTLSFTLRYQNSYASPAASATASNVVTGENIIRCMAGTWSLTGNGPCIVAVFGQYVSTAGATAPSFCRPGFTTLATGSISVTACVRARIQTSPDVKAPTKLKYGAKFLVSTITAVGDLALTPVATGPCVVTAAGTVKLKIAGVKRVIPAYTITALRTAGTCRVELFNTGALGVAPFEKVITVKVAKK